MRERQPKEKDSLAVRMPRVGLDDLVGLVIPQPDRRIESRSEEKVRVGREADTRDGGVVLVDQRLEALTRRSVPYPAIVSGGRGDET